MTVILEIIVWLLYKYIAEKEDQDENSLADVGIEPLDIDIDKSQSVMIDHREWTDQEIFRLMEGVEKYRDDWNKVMMISTR